MNIFVPVLYVHDGIKIQVFRRGCLRRLVDCPARLRLYGLSRRGFPISLRGNSQRLSSAMENIWYNNPQAADVKRTRRSTNKDQPCSRGAGAAVLADESVSQDQATL